VETPAANLELPATNPELPATNPELPATNPELPTANLKSPAAKSPASWGIAVSFVLGNFASAAIPSSYGMMCVFKGGAI
jgi:hypothetical protein